MQNNLFLKFWNDYHDLEEPPAVDLKEFVESWLLSEYHDKSEVKVLEIGCGSGKNLKQISKYFPNTQGCDVSESAIDICRDLGFNDCFVSNQSDVSLNDSEIDLIVLSKVLSVQTSLMNVEYLKKEIDRVLKPTGKILFVDFIYNNDIQNSLVEYKVKDDYKYICSENLNYSFYHFSADQIIDIFHNYHVKKKQEILIKSHSRNPYNGIAFLFEKA